MISVRPYRPVDRRICLEVFASNVPGAFAPNERTDYEAFLVGEPSDYYIVQDENAIIGSFGFSVDAASGRGRIRWIMTQAARRGRGLGGHMMREIRERAETAGVDVIDIAASQVSAPFFAKYGAVTIKRTPDGWGPGLDRVDMELPVVPARRST